MSPCRRSRILVGEPLHTSVAAASMKKVPPTKGVPEAKKATFPKSAAYLRYAPVAAFGVQSKTSSPRPPFLANGSHSTLTGHQSGGQESTVHKGMAEEPGSKLPVTSAQSGPSWSF